MASFDPNTWYQIYNASTGVSQVITLGGTGKTDSYAVLLMSLPISPIENTHWQILKLSDGSYGFVNRWLADFTGQSHIYNVFTTETLTQDGPAVNLMRSSDFPSNWPDVAKWQLTQDSKISGNRWYVSNLARGSPLYLYVNQGASGFLRLNQYSTPNSNCIWGFSSAAPILGSQAHLATSAAVQSSTSSTTSSPSSITSSASSSVSISVSSSSPPSSGSSSSANSNTSSTPTSISVSNSNSHSSSLIPTLFPQSVNSSSTSGSVSSTSTTVNGSDSKASNSMNTGSKVGIILAIIFGVGFFGMLAWFCIARERRYRRHMKATEGFYKQNKYKQMAEEMPSVSAVRHELPSQAHFAKELGEGYDRHELQGSSSWQPSERVHRLH